MHLISVFGIFHMYFCRLVLGLQPDLATLLHVASCDM